MTRREEVLQALMTALAGIPFYVPGVDVRRNEDDPTNVSQAGLVVLRDGDPGDPEVTLSPLAYHFRHQAEVEVIVQEENDGARDAKFDAVCAALGQVIAADRTLGGLCDWVEAMAPAPVDEPVFGAAGIKAASIPVILHYTTSDPLG